MLARTPTATYRPRESRMRQLGDAAATRARAAGLGAMAEAEAKIAARFAPARFVNSTKLEVQRALRIGPTCPRVRMRYALVAEWLGTTPITVLRVAAWAIENLHAKAVLFRRQHGAPLVAPVEVLHEAAIALRWMRRAGVTDEQYGELLAAMRAGSPVDEPETPRAGRVGTEATTCDAPRFGETREITRAER